MNGAPLVPAVSAGLAWPPADRPLLPALDPHQASAQVVDCPARFDEIDDPRLNADAFDGFDWVLFHDRIRLLTWPDGAVALARQPGSLFEPVEAAAWRQVCAEAYPAARQRLEAAWLAHADPAAFNGSETGSRAVS